jgi:hypothetical protein
MMVVIIFFLYFVMILSGTKTSESISTEKNSETYRRIVLARDTNKIPQNNFLTSSKETGPSVFPDKFETLDLNPTLQPTRKLIMENFYAILTN